MKNLWHRLRSGPTHWRNRRALQQLSAALQQWTETLSARIDSVDATASQRWATQSQHIANLQSSIDNLPAPLAAPTVASVTKAEVAQLLASFESWHTTTWTRIENLTARVNKMEQQQISAVDALEQQVATGAQPAAVSPDPAAPPADLFTLQKMQRGWNATTPSEFETLAISSFLALLNSPASAPIAQVISLFAFLEPDLSAVEVALLEPHERVVTHAEGLPTFPFEPVNWETATFEMPPRSRPTVWDPDPWANENNRFKIFEQPLKFVDIQNPDAAHPTVTVEQVEAPIGCFTNYLFEFDTTAEFDSPNCWRTPNLLTKRVDPKPGEAPWTGTGDLWDRSELRAALNICTDRIAGTNSVTFPFRAAAMSLPDSFGALGQSELMRIAWVLGHDLSPADAAREIYEFVRHFYLEAPTVGHRTPLDTFRTGIGQCGFVNGLAALLAELNEIPTRRVSGFNPLARQFRPGGGHSACEIHIDGHWSYWDPYLDLFTPGVGVEEFRVGHSAMGELPIFPINEVTDSSVPNPVTLRDLFRFRSHGDYFGRFPAISFSTGDRSTVGMCCEHPALNPPDDDPRPRRIYVRAAAIFTSGAPARLARSWEPLPPVVGATPWALTSFLHDPTK